MMEDQPDLKLRERMAVALGWREIWEVAGTLLGLPPKGWTPVGSGRWSTRWLEYEYYLPPWDLSLDACLRDALLVANAKGWKLKLVQEGEVFSAYLWKLIDLDAIRQYDGSKETPARAFCLAWLSLVEGEKGK